MLSKCRTGWRSKKDYDEIVPSARQIADDFVDLIRELESINSRLTNFLAG